MNSSQNMNSSSANNGGHSMVVNELQGPMTLKNIVVNNLLIDDFNLRVCFLSILQIITNTVLTVVMFDFLFYIETENVCIAPQQEDEWDRYISSNYDPKKFPPTIDVTPKFRNVIIIFAFVCIIGIIRCIVELIAHMTLWPRWIKAGRLLRVNLVITFAADVVLHIFRFQFWGRFCSGQYPEYSHGYAESQLLRQRGTMLILLVLWMWVSFMLFGFCLCSLHFVKTYLMKVAKNRRRRAWLSSQNTPINN